MQTSPTAPPLVAPGGSSGSSSSAAAAAPPVGTATADAGLLADLLRRANGDQGVVTLWLAEMGFRWDAGSLSAAQALLQQEREAERSAAATPLPLRQQYSSTDSGSGIKAVGTKSLAGAGGSNDDGELGSAWHSLAAVRGSPTKVDALRTKAAAGTTHTSPSKAPSNGPDADLDSRAAAAGAPRTFFCPISLQIMRDPVIVAATGQTYDRPCIERWLAQGNSSCPATGQALAAPVHLVPNVALRSSIEEWAEKYAPWLLDRHRRVKPVPKEDQFGAMPPAAGVTDPDLAMAIQLQQEELARLASQRRAAARGVATGGAVGGAPAAAPGTRVASARQRTGPPAYGQPLGGYGPGAPGAAPQPARRSSCFNATTLLLLAVTAAWVALYILSLAKNGWNLGDLSLNPWAGSDQAALLAVGAQEASLVTRGGQWWRLFTSPFVNAGVIQLLLNMSVLWTLGRHLEGALARQVAPLSIAAIFLMGSWVGALASANLNAYYVTCGASAGVCALLGATWADQLLWPKRYVNHVWTVLVLTLITGIFIVMSLLPLLDPWYTSAALMTGFLAAPVPLLAPRVRRGQRGARRWLGLQCLCAVLVVAGAALGAVGVATKAGVGTSAAFLQDGSCITFGRWQCLPAGSSPNGCQLEAQSDSQAPLLRCPSGVLSALPEGTSVLPGDTKALTQLCFQYCALSGGVTGGGSEGGGGDWGGASPPPPRAAPAGGSGSPSAGGGPAACGNTTVGASGPVLC